MFHFKASFVPPVSDVSSLGLQSPPPRSITPFRLAEVGSEKQAPLLPQVASLGFCCSTGRSKGARPWSRFGGSHHTHTHKHVPRKSTQYIGLGLSDPAVVMTLLRSLSRCSFSCLAHGCSSILSENSLFLSFFPSLFIERAAPLGRYKHRCWRSSL